MDEKEELTVQNQQQKLHPQSHSTSHNSLTCAFSIIVTTFLYSVITTWKTSA